MTSMLANSFMIFSVCQHNRPGVRKIKNEETKRNVKNCVEKPVEQLNMNDLLLHWRRESSH